MRDLFELMLLLQQQRRCLYFSVLRIFFFPMLFLCSLRCVINIDNIRSTNTFRSARQYYYIYFSFLHIQNSKYRLNIVWRRGNFYSIFSGSCHYIASRSFFWLSFGYIFFALFSFSNEFSERIAKSFHAMAVLLTLILIKVTRLESTWSC